MSPLPLPPAAPAAAAEKIPVYFAKTNGPDQRAQAYIYLGELTIGPAGVTLRGGRAPNLDAALATLVLGPVVAAAVQLAETKQVAADFDPATARVRHDVKLHRVSLSDRTGQWWAVSTSSNVMRAGDPYQMGAIAHALRQVCPNYERGSIARMPTAIKWMLIVLFVIGGLVALLLNFAF